MSNDPLLNACVIGALVALGIAYPWLFAALGAWLLSIAVRKIACPYVAAARRSRQAHAIDNKTFRRQSATLIRSYVLQHFQARNALLVPAEPGR